MNITLQPESGEPIYLQIVHAIAEGIRSGQLPPGYKLPTVRELSAQMKIARGTIKHAYDELGQMGLIEMTQGRGTFVLAQESSSRKERAMAAIDSLLDQLEKMSFTPWEIEVILQLKLRERSERVPHVRIAAVDCNPETLSVIVNQLSTIRDVDIYQFILRDVLASPNQVEEDTDLVVVTSTHYAQLERVIADRSRLSRIALSPAAHTVAELAKMNDLYRIGVLCVSDEFEKIARKGCASFIGPSCKVEAARFGAGGLEEFLARQDGLVVPSGYLAFCSGSEVDLIQAFGHRHPIVPYEYKIDTGSFLYLEDRVEEIRKRK